MRRPARVLLATRRDATGRPGGDGVLIDAIRATLEDAGHRVTVAGEVASDLSEVDIVHLFNLEVQPHTYLQAAHAARHGKPYLLTPLYWNAPRDLPPNAYAFPENGARRLGLAPLLSVAALTLAPRILGGMRGTVGRIPSLWAPRLQSKVLSGAARIFATGTAERQRILDHFPTTDPRRIHIARLGIHPSGAATDPEVPAPGFILCVGGIGPRKNQLGLAAAFAGDVDARLVFVGSASAGTRRYGRALERAAPGHSRFVSWVPHDRLPAWYTAASVVAQPSFVELGGLAAMEAAALGRPVVASDVAPVREYLEGLATFADPNDPASIHHACRRARAPDPARVAAFVRAHRWEEVLAPVRAAYDEWDELRPDRTQFETV